MMSLRDNELVKSGEKKSGRTVRSNNGQRRSKRGVPNVRRDSDADTDTVPGLRLSGVPETNSVGATPEVRKSDEGLYDREPLTGIERKIAKLNAYRTLLKKNIPLKGVPNEIQEEIIKEHKAWIESQVLIMLGQEASQTFTPDEVTVLKQMVSRVNNKLKSGLNELNKSLAKHNNVGNLGPPRPPEPVLSESAKNAQPMIPRMNQVNMTGASPEQVKIVEAARRLEAMDADGPVY